MQEKNVFCHFAQQKAEIGGLDGKEPNDFGLRSAF